MGGGEFSYHPFLCWETVWQYNKQKIGIAVPLKDKLLVKVSNSDYHERNNNIKEETVKWDKKGKKGREEGLMEIGYPTCPRDSKK